MLKPTQLACVCAAPFLSHTASGQAVAQGAIAAGGRYPGAAHQSQRGQPVTGRRRPAAGVASASMDASARARLAGGDPRHSRTSRPRHDILPGLGADFPPRRLVRLSQPAVPGYHALVAGPTWQARAELELALVGRNLPHARHSESGVAGMRQLAERGVFASASLRF